MAFNNMREDFKINGKIFSCDNFILVDNLIALNVIIYRGFIMLKTLKNCKDKNSIGFWRIKRKH